MAEETSNLNMDALWFALGRDRRPVVAIAAPSDVRALLNSRDWVDRPGQLAIQAVKQQLERYQENAKQAPQPPITTLFDATVQKIRNIIEDDTYNIEVFTGLFTPVLARAAWSWAFLPYNVVCPLQLHFSGSQLDTKRLHEEGDIENKDMDTWILQNEDYLRQRLFKADSNWEFGLVSLEICDDVFLNSKLTESAREISRPTVDGFKCLDGRRTPVVYIQPNNERYKQVFHSMTNGQLDGLDWSNIFVAGGMALGALLCVDGTDAAGPSEQWISSDIDIYMYGLNPKECNRKIEHIWTVFKKNLPADAPKLVVRNSKTVSFLSSYPLRRFQIILKIVRNPAEVLLNFDLDICAMGFDGEKLHMLPRAARALETGYNTFTMDMVQGHYLGTRRASQEQRVFKYADRGYGIRFLKSYTDSLKRLKPEELLPESGERPYGEPLDIDAKVAAARDYFTRVFKVYMDWTGGGQELRTHYVPRWDWGNRDVAWKGTSVKPVTDKPIFTHALLDTLNQNTSEPLRRSCLTGFELFYRHVAMWEAQQEGKLYIQADVWASTTYEDTVCRTSYEDLPCYAWDQSFSVDDFHQRITNFNVTQSSGFEEGFEAMMRAHPDLSRDELAKHLRIQRIVSGTTLEQVQQEDIVIPIWMPQDFVEYAQQVIREVSLEHEVDLGEVLKVIWTPFNSASAVSKLLVSLKHGEVELCAALKVLASLEHGEVDLGAALKALSESAPAVLVVFTLSPTAVYQQFDRRLDEIYEAVWSFMHSNSMIESSELDRARMLRRQFSRRALRRRSEDEFKDFACWIRRDPGTFAGEYFGGMDEGFWIEVEENNEDDDEEDGGEDYYDEDGEDSEDYHDEDSEDSEDDGEESEA